MCAIPGWFNAASVCASRVNRATRSGSPAKAAGRILIATSRLSVASRARYTSPIPPAPSGPTTSYGPSFACGLSTSMAHPSRLALREERGDAFAEIVAGVTHFHHVRVLAVCQAPLDGQTTDQLFGGA